MFVFAFELRQASVLPRTLTPAYSAHPLFILSS